VNVNDQRAGAAGRLAVRQELAGTDAHDAPEARRLELGAKADEDAAALAAPSNELGFGAPEDSLARLRAELAERPREPQARDEKEARAFGDAAELAAQIANVGAQAKVGSEVRNFGLAAVALRR
jgi:hypothetical protein